MSHERYWKTNTSQGGVMRVFWILLLTLPLMCFAESEVIAKGAVNGGSEVNATVVEVNNQTKPVANKDKQMIYSSGYSNDSFLTMVVGLVFVIGLIYGVAFFIKKTNMFASQQQGLMKIVATLQVGMKDKIILLNVSGEHMLVAVSPGNIRLLGAVHGDFGAEVDETAESEFAKKLQKMVSRGGF